MKPFTTVQVNKHHVDPAWQGHNEHLIDGLDTHNPIDSLNNNNNLTSDIHLVGKNGAFNTNENTPLAVVKPAIHHEIDQFAQEFPEINHFRNLSRFTTAHREATYDKMANDVFGLGQFVPKTTTFMGPDDKKPYSAQEYIHNTKPLSDSKQFSHIMHPHDIHKLAIMNKLMGNNDRNKGNVIVQKNTQKPFLIDNALSFDMYNHFGNPTPYYAIGSLQEKVPNVVHKWLQGLDIEKGANILKEKGAPDLAIKNFRQRAEEAKRWSKLVQENPKVAQHLGSLLGVIHHHREKRSHEIHYNPKQDIERIYSAILKGDKEAGFNEWNHSKTKLGG